MTTELIRARMRPARPSGSAVPRPRAAGCRVHAGAGGRVRCCPGERTGGVRHPGGDCDRAGWRAWVGVRAGSPYPQLRAVRAAARSGLGDAGATQRR